MTNGREYTNKDPLVKAIYDILAPEKAEEESTELEEAPGKYSKSGDKEKYQWGDINQALMAAGIKPMTILKVVAGLRDKTLKETTELEEALSLPNEKELAMANTQLNFLCHASMEIRNHLMDGGGFPEWFQNKLSGLHNSMEDLHSYMAGKEAGDQKVQTEQVKTIKVGEDAVGTDAKLHYAVVSDRKVQAVGEKEEMLDYCKENGGRVWKTAKQVGDLVEETN